MARGAKSGKAGSKRSFQSLQAKAVDERKGTSVRGGKRNKGTPKLFEAACKGTHIPEVVIE
jgi:hypothetical protein